MKHTVIPSLSAALIASIALQPQSLAATPLANCRDAIAAAEATQNIPDHLLAAIGHVESGRPDPTTGTISPWPWTVDINGDGHFYANKQQAIAAVVAARARGERSIDVGCLQINLLQHPDAFTSLEQAFDPNANANFGASFLRTLHDQLGTWPQATGAYHSQTPALGLAYERDVMRIWPQEKHIAGAHDPESYIQDFSAAIFAGPHSDTAAGRQSPLNRYAAFVRMGPRLPPMGLALTQPNSSRKTPSPGLPETPKAPGRTFHTLADYRRTPIRMATRHGIL